MSIDTTWLRCPNCFRDLSPVGDRVVGCGNGHRFDRSKYGYLTLLAPGAPKTAGDDRGMLAARAELLNGGAYAPIAAKLLETVESGVPDPGEPLRVADLGCGTGYYAARLVGAQPGLNVLLADRSPHAVRTALRSVPDSSGIVLDIWQPLPLRDAVADAIVNVFAPRNPDEFARVLHPTGRLVVVVPRADHLRELRDRGMLLDVPAAKAHAVAERLSAAGLVPSGTTSVEYGLTTDRDSRALLAGMGPSAHHVAALLGEDRESGTGTGADETVDVTVAVDVLTFVHA